MSFNSGWPVKHGRVFLVHTLEKVSCPVRGTCTVAYTGQVKTWNQKSTAMFNWSPCIWTVRVLEWGPAPNDPSCEIFTSQNVETLHNLLWSAESHSRPRRDSFWACAIADHIDMLPPLNLSSVVTTEMDIQLDPFRLAQIWIQGWTQTFRPNVWYNKDESSIGAV